MVVVETVTFHVNVTNRVMKFPVSDDLILESRRVIMIDDRGRLVIICPMCTPFFGQDWLGRKRTTHV